MGFVGRKTLREKLSIDVLAQLKVYMLKAHGRQDDTGMEFIALDVGEPNTDAVLRAAIAVTTFGPGGDAPGNVDDEVTLTLLSQRPMILQDSEVEMQDRLGAMETAVDDSADHVLLLTMSYRRSAQRCCAISFLAPTLTYSVGRCWAINLSAWGPSCCGLSQMQGRCGAELRESPPAKAA